MRFPHLLAMASVAMSALGTGRPAWGQPEAPSIQLVVDAGRPLRVALDQTTKVKRVGQPVTATLVEPVYAYDRGVLPVGTKVAGHIAKLQPVPRTVRLRAMLSGDFSPPRRVLLQFDTLVLSDGRTQPIQTSVTEGTEHVTLQVAGASKEDSVATRARREIAREAKQAASVVTAPGKLTRLRDMAFNSLPYRPQLLRKGTVYSARLDAALDFGPATPMARAPAGTPPAPDSVLNARLVTPLHSGTSERGGRVEAVLTQPVFSDRKELILPEGAALTGAVTLTRRARRFHRNGQLRFLFEHVRAPDRATEPMLASLYSVESGHGDRVALDEEGGATVTNAKARFVAPALGALALVGSMHGHLDYDTDGAGPEMAYGGVGSSSLGGFIGMGALGIGLSQISRPIGLTIAVVGFVRTTHSAIFGKGRDVVFPADTVIQVQLAPGPGASRPR